MIIDEIKKKIRSFDYLMLFLASCLAIFGIIIIGSAKHINITGTHELYTRQQLWFISGVLFCIIVSCIDYRFITKFYIVSYVVNILFLVLVLAIGSSTDKGATRGLELFAGISIQPSEFAKIFMLIFMSKFVEKYNEKINNIFLLIFLFIAIIIPVILVQRQPSLSASIVTLTTSICIIFLGGLSYKYIAAALAIGIPSAIIVIQDILRPDHLFIDKILGEYQIQDRILPFLRPETASSDTLYQVKHSVQAIASGQLTGQGLYEGTLNSLNYIPASHNDFIVAVIGEEFGFVGCMAVLTIMLIIVIKCILIAYKADTLAGKYIAGGVAFMFAFQTFVNVGVATSLLPNTGMSLPFVSYGGSAMWINMICLGLVINVGMVRTKSFFEE